jgi:hypothetical protein
MASLAAIDKSNYISSSIWFTGIKKASHNFLYEALKTAAIYSPTLRQYHRRGQA